MNPEHRFKAWTVRRGDAEIEAGQIGRVLTRIDIACEVSLLTQYEEGTY